LRKRTVHSYNGKATSNAWSIFMLTGIAPMTFVRHGPDNKPAHEGVAASAACPVSLNTLWSMSHEHMRDIDFGAPAIKSLSAPIGEALKCGRITAPSS
jgi:hypothetical protein